MVKPIKRLSAPGCKSENEYREVYKFLKSNKVFGAKNIYELLGKLYELQNEVSPFKIISTLYIMFELGLIEQSERDGFIFPKGVHNSLQNSIIYKFIETFNVFRENHGRITNKIKKEFYGNGI